MISIFLLTVTITTGQYIAPPTLNKKEVSIFLESLNNRMADSTRIDILLQLAEYHILKNGENKADLDSAAALIIQVDGLQSKLRLQKLDGYIMLVKSRLAKEKDNAASGEALLNKSIPLLESADDAFHLALAHLAFLRYVFEKNDPQFPAIFKNLMPSIFSQLQKIKNEKQTTDCILAIEHFHQSLYGVDLEIKLSFLNNFLSACRAIKNGPGEIWIRKEIADTHFKQGKAKEAEKELLELLKFQKDGGYPHICFTYNVLANVYLQTSDFKNALYYALETIKSVKGPLDSSNLPNFYYRITGIYSVSGNPEQNYRWSLKHLEHEMQTGQTSLFYDACNNIIGYLINNKRPTEALKFIQEKIKKYPPMDIDQEKQVVLSLGRCYKALKNNLLAEKYCREIIRLHEIKPDPNDFVPLAFVAEFYLTTKQYTKAEHHLKILLKEFVPSATTYRDYYNSRYMYEIDSARGKYFSAFNHLKKYKVINDSIFNATKNKQIEELTIAYQTDLKEDSISLLQKTNALQQANIRQSDFIKNLTIAGIILAFLITALLYRQYRLKQRSNHVITYKNELLQHLLTEKEWLIKEIHHRVKNNLQVVISLLNSQSAYIDNDAALKAIHDSRHRVQAMSLIHQKLYNTENVTSLDMSVYIRELVFYLSDSYGTGQRIRFELDTFPLQMDVSQAVPLGLILNEAITNSIKYAFPHDSTGLISISLSNTSSTDCLLTVSDNGVGLPANSKKTGSLGMSLMKGLSKDLNGTFSIATDNGTTIRITFAQMTVIKNKDIKAATSIAEEDIPS